MKKNYILFILAIVLGLNCCKTPIKDVEPDKPIKPVDPLADVAFNIVDNYIVAGANPDSTIMYTVDDKLIREGKDIEGKILYTRDGEFIYAGDKAKGLPKCCIIGDYICLYSTSGALRATLVKDNNYLRKSSNTFSQPMSYYWGEVVFNIDGYYLRQGRQKSSKVIFTISGDNYHQGEGSAGSVVFNRDGNYLRMGSSKSGAIIFTIKDGIIYKGKDSEVVSFNITDNFIRKGKLKTAIGEN